MSHYYYHAVQANVTRTGWHFLSSNSRMITYIFIYKDKFNSLNPFQNLLSTNDSSCGYGHFSLSIYLQAGTKYVLVVTTFRPNVTGTFLIHLLGPKIVTFKWIGKYLCYGLNN